MAVFNALSRGELSRALRNALEVTDGESGLERFSETLQPTIDLWSQPEWRFLRREMGFARRLSVPAVALRFSVVEATLATTTSVLVVVEDILATTNSTFQIDSGGAVAANPVLSRGLPLDDRNPQIGEVSQLLLTQGDTATGTNLPQWIKFTADSRMPQWVMEPGSRLFIAGPAVATQLDICIRWRERRVQPGERGQ